MSGHGRIRCPLASYPLHDSCSFSRYGTHDVDTIYLGISLHLRHLSPLVPL